MKNRDHAGDAILTEASKTAIIDFASSVDFRRLNCGLRNLLLFYIRTEECAEIWFSEFLPEVQLLFNLCDELSDEYVGDGS